MSEKQPVRYMVAVDYSNDSSYAFEEVCKMMDKDNDFLFILAVAEMISIYPAAPMSGTIIAEAQHCMERKIEMLLCDYADRCRAAGVKNFKTLLGRGSHIGDVICRAAEEKKINIIVVGRRGMSAVKRLFIGSTSRYCMEHAPCNVLCVKLPHDLEHSPQSGSPAKESPAKKKHTDDHKDDVKKEGTHEVASNAERFVV